MTEYEIALRKSANDIGVSVAYLDTVVYIESKRNPKARNPYTGATGLIQFMPNTANELGTTTDQIYNMSISEQFNYVTKYYKRQLQYTGKSIDSLEDYDIYLLTFYPKAVGKGLGYIYPQNVYSVNRVLDNDKNGILTNQDIADFFRKNKQYTYETEYIQDTFRYVREKPLISVFSLFFILLTLYYLYGKRFFS